MNKLVKTQRTCYWLLMVTILFVYRMFYYEGVAGYTFIMGTMALMIYIYMFFKSLPVYGNIYYRTELYIALSTFITYLLSIIIHGQSPTIISAYLIPFSFVPYFFLVRKNANAEMAERVLVIVAVLYVFCWFYQVSQIPNIIFGNREALDNDRGFARFYIATKEHLPFLMFYFLSCYTIRKHLLYVILALLVFGVVILHVSRQMIVWSGLVALAYIVYVNKDKAKNIIACAILAIVAFSIMTRYFTVLNDLMSMTEEGMGGINELGTGNIRFEAMGRFISDFNTNVLSILFGSGYAAPGTSLYSKITWFENQGFYLSDVGFVGLYVTQGLVSVILYSVLLFKVLFRHKVPREYLYIKFYIGYIVLSYLGSHALTSNLILVMTAIYILKSTSNRMLSNPRLYLESKS